MKKRFCPRCGRTGLAMVRGFCVECFLQMNKLVEVPDSIALTRCRNCGRVLMGPNWRAFSTEEIRQFGEQKVKISRVFSNAKIVLDFEEGDEEEPSRLRGKVIGSVEEEFFEIPALIPVEFKETLCPDCGLIAADYFEAELQFRFSKKDAKFRERVVEEAKLLIYEMQRHDPLSQITSMGRAPNGVDIKVGSKRAGKVVAEKMAKKFRGEIKRSFSLAGVDRSGKTRKRYTFLVRI